MLIGALIGLFIAAFWTWIGLTNLYRQKAQLKARGFQPKLTIYYAPMVIRHLNFALAGAIIGHFVGS